MLAWTRHSFTTTLLLALSLSVYTDDTAAAGSSSPQRYRLPRHHPLSRLEPESSNHTLAKRFDNTKWTYYKTGEGACGAESKDSDWIVALNTDQYDNGAHCFKGIVLSYNGKSTRATVVDRCPGCSYGGLDLSPALFSYFAPESQGIIYGSWEFE